MICPFLFGCNSGLISVLRGRKETMLPLRLLKFCEEFRQLSGEENSECFRRCNAVLATSREIAAYSTEDLSSLK